MLDINLVVDGPIAGVRVMASCDKIFDKSEHRLLKLVDC